MAVIPMSKIRIYADKNVRYSVTDLLQERGWVEIRDIADNVDSKIQEYFAKEGNELELSIANQEFAINFLKKFLPQGAKLPKMTFTSREYEELIASYYYKDKVEKCLQIQEETVKAEGHIKSLAREEDVLIPWENFSLPLHDDMETEYTRMLVGSIPARDFEVFKKNLEALTSKTEIQIINQSSDNVYFSILIEVSVLDDVSNLLFQSKFSSAEFLKRRGNPKEELDRIRRNRKKTLEHIETLRNEGVRLATEIPKLSAIYDHLVNMKHWKESRKKFLHTDDNFCIEGWIPTEHYAEMKKSIEKITSASLVLKVEPDEGEIPPVEIHNNFWISPFESVTRLYGLPQYNEVDPTPFLAAFFAIYFGICLTDAGYGIVIVSLTALALFLFKLPNGTKKLTITLLWGGISTIFFGALAGGWFGTDPASFPDWMTYNKEINGVETRMFIGQLINPLKEPLIFLGFAFVLGYFQAIVGKMIDGWWKMKQGNFWDGLLDGWLWVYSLTSLAAVVAVNAIGIESAKDPALYALYIALILLVLTQGRKSSNIVAKAFNGVLGLYGFVGYISDMLSYSRLLALGLATGIIATSVNMIAWVVADLIPYVGVVFMVLILVVGHLFNIALNALGAFVHSGRLQFVEFFGKFMEGGGLAFRPFRKVFKYITLGS